MKKYLLILSIITIGCESRSDTINTAFVGFQVDCHPIDKSKTGIYSYYTHYSTGINLNYDTTIKAGDTIILKYFGKHTEYKLIRTKSGWRQIK